MHSANTVYESLVKAAKEVGSITEANIAAVSAQSPVGKRKATA
jgi:hypothetical protein